MRKRSLLIVVLVFLIVSACITKNRQNQKQQKPKISEEVLKYLKEQGIDVNAPVGPMLSSSEMDAKLNVDCSNLKGEFLHAEKYNNFSHNKAFAEQRKKDVQFYNKQGLHGKIYRVWMIGNKFYDEKTGTVNLEEMTDYLIDANNVSDFIMLNCSHFGVVRGWDMSSEEKIVRLAKILKEVKRSFPAVKYVEAMNEPDYAHEGVTPENYYQYYKIYYEAVNKVNEDLNPEVPLLIGGPSVSQFSLQWLCPFLDDYIKDPSTEKRIDFISYHGYYTKPDSVYQLFKDNPELVYEQRSILNKELEARGLSTDIPVFVTEMGIYPGPSFDDFVTMKNDHLRQASGVASLLYWYMNSDNVYPFNWVLRHQTEGRKDQLVTRDEKGQPYIHTEKFTPYGNMMVMMSKMKKNRIEVNTSTEINKGLGLYSFAAKDSSGVSVMLWNYQSKNTEGYKVDVEIDNLPVLLKSKITKARIYSIDRNTSNYHASIDNCDLTVVDEKNIDSKSSYSTILTLDPNTLKLIIIE